MRLLPRIIAVLAFLFVVDHLYRVRHVPAPRVNVPLTRYHGYELNRLAINKAKAFTVLISNEGWGGTGRGTGVLIDSMHVLTCAHMIEGAHDDTWIFPYPTGIVVKGRPVFVNTEEDLAVLELSKPVVVAHYAVFQDMHYDGEPITVVGNTKGSMKWFVTFGIISGDFENYLLTDAVLYGGNSGGPWINEQGEVVGLTDFTFINRDGSLSEIHGGVSAKTIHGFLQRWKAPSMADILQSILTGGAK